MKNVFYKILLIIIIMLSTGCSNNSVNGIVIPKYLLWNACEKGISYKDVFRKALNGDPESIREFSLLSFYGQYSYDHGDMMVYLIDRIGEARFIDAVKTFDEKGKCTIDSYLSVGLEYGDNPKYSGKRFRDAFPKIYEFVEARE